MSKEEMRTEFEFRLNLVAFEFQDLDYADAQAILKKIWDSWKRQERRQEESARWLKAS